jgi:4'-phosphopantetheinyl transferase
MPRTSLETLLRGVLAPLLGLPAEALNFGREAQGRPLLRHAHAPDFNLSDTTGGSLIAICANGRVGIDVERRDRRMPVARLSARWFAAEEAAALARLPEEIARETFLRLWTAKEAACKATGTGISGYLPQWRFDIEGDSLRLRALPAGAGDADRWRFFPTMPSTEHTATLALRDAPEPLFTRYSLRP